MVFCRIGEGGGELSGPASGSASFTKHEGQSAAIFVNAHKGSALRLRGVYARVVKLG